VDHLASPFQTLKVGDFQARWEIVQQAKDWGEEAVAPLVALSEESQADVELQWFIAKLLGSLPYPGSIIALTHLLQYTEDEEVRFTAGRMLAGFDSSAIAPLQELLSDPQKRPAALCALSEIEHPEVVPLLIEAARTGPVPQQVTALHGLEKFQAPAIVPLLVENLQDVSAEVRQAAITGLMARGGEECSVAVLVEQIIPLLNDDSLAVAIQASHALGRLATEQCASVLAQHCCISDVPLALQQSLIRSLGQIHSMAALQGLCQIWSNLNFRQPGIECLIQAILASVANMSGTAERAAAAQWLLELLRSPILANTAAIRVHAVSALGRVATATLLPEVVTLLRDPDHRVRLHIIAALKQLDALQARGLIQMQAQADLIAPELKEGLIIALREW
jgi:HEAT repeat protein